MDFSARQVMQMLCHNQFPIVSDPLCEPFNTTKCTIQVLTCIYADFSHNFVIRDATISQLTDWLNDRKLI